MLAMLIVKVKRKLILRYLSKRNLSRSGKRAPHAMLSPNGLDAALLTIPPLYPLVLSPIHFINRSWSWACLSAPQPITMADKSASR